MALKLSYNWLKNYCDCGLPAHELAGRLSHCGVAVEGYEPRGQDWTLDLEIKSNRPDLLCHVGVAREVAAVTGARLRRPEAEVHDDPSAPVEGAASVEVTAPDLCPHYTARVIRGVKVGPSPDWLRERLEVCGLRPVNNVVDATNCVMLECGQPLHAFDLARVGGARVIVRRAQPGETITTIDGSEHELKGDECVIADAFKPIALAGVMGGLDSEISQSTRDILIEAARFEPTSIRRTSRRHGLSSDSSYRFERGVDPEGTEWASRRVCQLILKVGGGRLLGGVAEVRTDTTETPEVRLRYARLELLLGLRVPREEVLGILRGLEMEVLRADDEAATVRIPTWRGDLTREVDLIEEVARIHGYDKISETTQMPVRPAMPSCGELAQRRARRLLAGEGFTEVMTYSLVRADGMQVAQPWTDVAPVGVRNPVSVERTHLRLTNMANLLELKRFNAAHGTPRVDLFEMGHVYLPGASPEATAEKLCVTLLTDRPEGLRVLKGVLANLLDELGIETQVAEKPGVAGPFAPDECVELRLDGALLGCAGVLSEGAAEELDLTGRPALMEADLDLLVERCRFDRPYRPVPAFPSTGRDLAVVVDEDVLWADMEGCIRRSAPETLASVELFDVYRGEPVLAGRKSVAFSLTFRRQDRTITAEEAEQAREAVLDALRARFCAELR
jgi:phenylalanyl-tRNA synthetase beta chain